jgi:transmembrane sensor
MSELTRKMEDLRDAVRTDWSAERSDRVIAAVAATRRRRTAAGVVVAVAMTTAFGVVTVKGWGYGPRTAPREPELAAEIPDPSTLILPDGSRVVSKEPASRLHRRIVSQNRVVLELASGGAHFDVVPNPERRFEVEAGAVTVTVVGTAFEVHRTPGATQVSVERGKVRVTWAGGSADVAAGESGFFPPPTPPPASDEVELPRPTPAREVAAAASPPPSPQSAPAITPIGSHAVPLPSDSSKPAPFVAPSLPSIPVSSIPFPAPTSGPPPSATPKTPGVETAPVADPVADLMTKADALRGAGRDAEAVVPLKSVVELHATDPRASVAAFSLGKLYLEKLDEPMDAAIAFATCRERDPHGALAEDALAREVESLFKAGALPTARVRASEYLRLYPQGSRVTEVKAWGRLE